mmetsp:Transcript_18801/g.65246  ORF Transcript_18801/g.65246 Transcript_18801/m.65246 type:complete len:237 (-) Transcript_18801:29-739(-)
MLPHEPGHGPVGRAVAPEALVVVDGREDLDRGEVALALVGVELAQLAAHAPRSDLGGRRQFAADGRADDVVAERRVPRLPGGNFAVAREDHGPAVVAAAGHGPHGRAARRELVARHLGHVRDEEVVVAVADGSPARPLVRVRREDDVARRGPGLGDEEGAGRALGAACDAHGAREDRREGDARQYFQLDGLEREKAVRRRHCASVADDGGPGRPSPPARSRPFGFARRLGLASARP